MPSRRRRSVNEPHAEGAGEKMSQQKKSKEERDVMLLNWLHVQIPIMRKKKRELEYRLTRLEEDYEKLRQGESVHRETRIEFSKHTRRMAMNRRDGKDWW